MTVLEIFRRGPGQFEVFLTWDFSWMNNFLFWRAGHNFEYLIGINTVGCKGWSWTLVLARHNQLLIRITWSCSKLFYRCNFKMCLVLNQICHPSIMASMGEVECAFEYYISNTTTMPQLVQTRYQDLSDDTETAKTDHVVPEALISMARKFDKRGQNLGRWPILLQQAETRFQRVSNHSYRRTIQKTV